MALDGSTKAGFEIRAQTSTSALVPPLPLKMAAYCCSPRYVCLGEWHDCPCGPAVPGSAICHLSPAVFSFCWQTIGAYLWLLWVAWHIYSWSNIGACSSVAIGASENQAKACPVLIWFLEASEATQKYSPLVQLAEHRSFLHASAASNNHMRMGCVLGNSCQEWGMLVCYLNGCCISPLTHMS